MMSLISGGKLLQCSNSSCYNSLVEGSDPDLGLAGGLYRDCDTYNIVICSLQIRSSSNVPGVFTNGAHQEEQMENNKCFSK